MRKLKEVLRLHFELHLDQRQIARSCSISVSTVHQYLKRAETAGVGWPVPADWNDARLQAAFFPPAAITTRPCKDTLDCEEIQRQLRAGRHVTLQLLWEEYRAANPNGYRYSRYCEIYQRWRKKQSVVMRQEHTPGEKAFIDWQAPRSLYMTGIRPPSARLRCSWPYSAPVPTPTPRSRAISKWNPGSEPTNMPSSSGAAYRL